MFAEEHIQQRAAAHAGWLTDSILQRLCTPTLQQSLSSHEGLDMSKDVIISLVCNVKSPNKNLTNASFDGRKQPCSLYRWSKNTISDFSLFCYKKTSIHSSNRNCFSALLHTAHKSLITLIRLTHNLKHEFTLKLGVFFQQNLPHCIHIQLHHGTSIGK